MQTCSAECCRLLSGPGAPQNPAAVWRYAEEAPSCLPWSAPPPAPGCSAPPADPRRGAPPPSAGSPTYRPAHEHGRDTHEDHHNWKIIAEEATLCEGHLSFRLSSLEAILSDEPVGLGKSLRLRLQQILQCFLLRLGENTRAEKHKGLKLNRAAFFKDLKCYLLQLCPLYSQRM